MTGENEQRRELYMIKHFQQHPHSVGETYKQHMGFALWFAINMLVCGIALVIHAIFPFIFIKTGSKGLERMLARYQSRVPPTTNQSEGAISSTLSSS